MKATVICGLDGSHELYATIKDLIVDSLAQREIDLLFFSLSEMNISYCNGCGYCGEKEIGYCIKKDSCDDIYRSLASSDIYILVSKTSFGGFDSSIKILIDRLSPMGLGFYTINEGELHHPIRYGAPISLITIGLSGSNFEGERETFELMSSRLQKCFFAKSGDFLLIDEDESRDGINTRIRESIEAMEVRCEN